jgi:hypothetical protein
MVGSIWGTGSGSAGWLTSSTLGIKLKWLVKAVFDRADELPLSCVLEPSVLGK